MGTYVLYRDDLTGDSGLLRLPCLPGVQDFDSHIATEISKGCGVRQLDECMEAEEVCGEWFVVAS
jgi:hypothetical protein